MKTLAALLLVVFLAQFWSYGETASLEKDEDCPLCLDVYQPVCGINGKGNKKTFPNECELDQYNCFEGDDYELESEDVCPGVVQPDLETGPSVILGK
ncbi:vasotab-like [Agrilus planipennis]|uniref:Vasotab-like n=1 Tax=Agrilus planipennis TaxID=224129 RepID=A0A7F5R3J3_AGRPL|nr:vasotab-like [Agrilus planipennis]